MSSEPTNDQTETEVDVRPRITEVLRLLAELRAQEEYQRRAPSVSVPAELFNQWGDWYFPEDSSFRGEFSPSELRALETFDKTLRRIADGTPPQLPALEAFSQTQAWMELRDAAERALASISASTGPEAGMETGTR